MNDIPEDWSSSVLVLDIDKFMFVYFCFPMHSALWNTWQHIRTTIHFSNRAFPATPGKLMMSHTGIWTWESEFLTSVATVTTTNTTNNTYLNACYVKLCNRSWESSDSINAHFVQIFLWLKCSFTSLMSTGHKLPFEIDLITLWMSVLDLYWVLTHIQSSDLQVKVLLMVSSKQIKADAY